MIKVVYRFKMIIHIDLNNFCGVEKTYNCVRGIKD
jgi:hypothetical protein